LSRWYLVHWIVYHSLVIMFLFMASVLIFIIQNDLFKLIGLAPLALAFVTIFLTTKVYNLFVEMGSPPLPGHVSGPMPGPSLVSEDVKHFQSGYEFYPVDPVSLGVARRLELHSYRPERNLYDSDISLVSQ